MSASIYWLIIGVFCIALEAFGITGVGLFFAGLGAFVTGILIEAGLIGTTAYIAQLACFFGFTAAAAAALWKSLKKWQLGRSEKNNFSNMIGERGTVADAPLLKGKEGKVMWSGAPMIAELVAGSTVETVAAGESVIIKDIKGNKLLVDII